jgi:hypothetical protein
MPLVPPLPLVWPVDAVDVAAVGKLEVMLKDSTHPFAEPPKAQLWGIPTKSQSVFCPEL